MRSIHSYGFFLLHLLSTVKESSKIGLLCEYHGNFLLFLLLCITIISLQVEGERNFFFLKSFAYKSFSAYLWKCHISVKKNDFHAVYYKEKIPFVLLSKNYSSFIFKFFYCFIRVRVGMSFHIRIALLCMCHSLSWFNLNEMK